MGSCGGTPTLLLLLLLLGKELWAHQAPGCPFYTCDLTEVSQQPCESGTTGSIPILQTRKLKLLGSHSHTPESDGARLPAPSLYRGRRQLTGLINSPGLPRGSFLSLILSHSLIHSQMNSSEINFRNAPSLIKDLMLFPRRLWGMSHLPGISYFF